MPDNDEEEFEIPEPNEPVFRFNAHPEEVNRFVEAARRIQQNNPVPRIRRNRNLGEVLDTVGIELESLGLTRDKASSILGSLPNGIGSNFNVHRDGSSEINIYTVPVNTPERYIQFSSHTKESEDLFARKYDKSVSGYELISNPLYIDSAELTLAVLLPALENNGDFVSERCATHIHVGGMKNLNFLKNCLKLGLWFDEVFYSLAHLDSDKFRGYSNNAIYARPLQNGPYFKYNRYYYQMLNWQKALEAKDLYEFYACYGVNVENGEPPKYHPGRYFSINLFSIIRIGTIEFRHFNQSFNPDMVIAITKLCQLFVEVAIKAKSSDLESLVPGDVFKTRTTSYYLDKLNQFLNLAEKLECDYLITSDEYKTLSSIIRNYKGIGIEDVEVLTHCRDFEISGDIMELGGFRRSKDKPIPDGHTDIHNIQYSSIIKE
jgi:hypothetical protein